MFKFRAFRLGNSFLLGLVGLLAGCTLFLSHSAGADSQGTDCPPDWSYLSAACYSPGVLETVDTGESSCATSPTGLCCTYEGYKAYCDNVTRTQIGYTYVLTKPGESGKTCYEGKCY